MESNAFGSSHLPSQALVVLSEAASGLHEALRGQRPFPTRLPDAKDLHNMSLVGSYGTHLLHSFHPHLLQTLNHGMLANGGPASYFASERGGLGKPSVLSNFQLPSAFSPPKYIGISLDQNLFNGSESFRTDSASPTCTSHESMEGSNDYDAEKGESPRSNNSDPRDLRHVHSSKASTSSATTISSVASAAAAAAAAAAASVASSTASTVAVAAHLGHHHHHQHHPPPHHHHHANGSLLASSMSGLNSMQAGGCGGLRSVSGGIVGGLTAVGIGGAGVSLSGGNGGHVPDICPVCGIKLTPEEWNSHFLTELDRLYKLSSGMERSSLQATYMFAPPCPAQENAIRTSHNRWETFQRIRNNRQNRLRIKVRKRKYGNDLYFMENLFCSSCPICKRKYAMETGKMPMEDDVKMQDEIETVDVESCNDDVPDSGSEIQTPTQNMSISGSVHANSGGINSGSGSHNQTGKLEGILYRTACVINKDSSAGGAGGGEDEVTTNVIATSSSCSSSGSSNSGGNCGAGGATSNWAETHANVTPTTQGHISVKNVSELSSTTHHFYNADSCGDERGGGGVNAAGNSCNGKDLLMESCNNDSDEDVIVDDDDSIKITMPSTLCKKRKYDERTAVVSSRSSENHSPLEERPRSEPQVTSTEPEIANNNNNINTKYVPFEDLRIKQPTTQPGQHPEPDNGRRGSPLLPSGLTQLDTKVGISSENKPDDENKCFICKTGIKDLSSDSFFRGRNLYFHQSCANVMSSYRLSKELQQQHQHQQQQQHLDAQKSPLNCESER